MHQMKFLIFNNISYLLRRDDTSCECMSRVALTFLRENVNLQNLLKWQTTRETICCFQIIYCFAPYNEISHGENGCSAWNREQSYLSTLRHFQNVYLYEVAHASEVSDKASINGGLNVINKCSQRRESIVFNCLWVRSVLYSKWIKPTWPARLDIKCQAL